MENKTHGIDALRLGLGLFFMGCVMSVTLFLIIDGNEGQMSNYVLKSVTLGPKYSQQLIGLINLNPIFWLGVLIVSCWLLFCNEKLK